MFQADRLPKSTRLMRTLAGIAIALAASAPLAAWSADTLVIQSEGAEHTFQVDVVDTAATRAQGLMNVPELAPDAGMLFDFKQSRPVAFWMENTLIPLDMLFIEADGTILNIHAEAIPGDRTSIPSAGPVQFVLEIPGGRAAELGIEAGDMVEHARIMNGEPAAAEMPAAAQ